jgi:hypothetical protein
MSTESDTPENAQPAPEVAAPAPVPQAPTQQAPAPQASQGFDPRRRLRELLSVPERDRTDPQWDEINELEIQLAPGNRVAPGQQPGSSDKPVGGRQFQQKKHPPKGGGGGGGGNSGGTGGGGGGKRRPRPGGNPNNPNKPQQQ